MISVIIPTYNSCKYLCEAIDSVLKQTCTDYEILVVDDGSTDDTGVLVQSNYPSIKYVRTENRGVSHARNLGISKARGDLIAFLDADDRWLPEKLEKQVALFNEDKSLGMVFTENFFFDENGISAFTADKKNRLMQGNVVRNIFLNSYVVTSTVMVRKSIFERVGMFDEELSVAEDDNMWMRIGMNYGVALVDEKLVMYRSTAGSLSSDSAAVMTGVEHQLQLLSTRYYPLYVRLGPLAIRKKYADLQFARGYHEFKSNNYRWSRTHFINSFLSYPVRVRPLLYLLSTFLPAEAIQRVRCAKRTAAKDPA